MSASEFIWWVDLLPKIKLKETLTVKWQLQTFVYGNFSYIDFSHLSFDVKQTQTFVKNQSCYSNKINLQT